MSHVSHSRHPLTHATPPAVNMPSNMPDHTHSWKRLCSAHGNMHTNYIHQDPQAFTCVHRHTPVTQAYTSTHKHTQAYTSIHKHMQAHVSTTRHGQGVATVCTGASPSQAVPMHSQLVSPSSRRAWRLPLRCRRLLHLFKLLNGHKLVTGWADVPLEVPRVPVVARAQSTTSQARAKKMEKMRTSDRQRLRAPL